MKSLPRSLPVAEPRWITSGPASDGAIEMLHRRWPDRVPEDYIRFLRWSDGAEIGGNTLWSAEETASDPYQAREFGPDWLLFGSDHIGGTFGFDLRSQGSAVWFVECISNWDEDSRLAGRCIEQFLRRLELQATLDDYVLNDPPPAWTKVPRGVARSPPRCAYDEG